MRRSRSLPTASFMTVLLTGGLAWGALAEGREGLYGGFSLGVGEASFRLADDSDSDGDTGAEVGGRLGWGLTDRLGLSFELQSWNASYELRVLGAVIERYDMRFRTVGVGVQYLLPVTPRGHGVVLRGLLGATQQSIEASDGDRLESETGTTAGIGVGFEWFLGENFALGVDLFGRATGLEVGGKEVRITGLHLNFQWY